VNAEHTGEEETMAKVTVTLAMSLDGYIAGPGDSNELPLGEGGEALFEWYFNGDTPSKYYSRFRLSKTSAEVFDAEVESVGAVVTGRRTYDIARAWGGDGPVPGRPLFVLTHSVPADVPETSVPYTFVTDGIDSAITQAKAAAGGKCVSLMGSQAAQQCLRAGLLDEIQVAVVPLLLGGGVRLLDHIGGPVRLEPIRVVDAPGVTHLSYRVGRR
jgi:dihydrofolate reductase